MSFVYSSEKAIEYELEDEDEHDSGRIAGLERLFFAWFAICWHQSIGRVLMIALCSSRRNLAPRQSSNRFRSGIVLVLGYLRPYCYLRDTGTLRNRIKISLASKPLHLQPKPKSGDEGEESCVEDPVAQMDPVGRSLAK